MKLNYWSHACIQIESDKSKVLFDPWILQQPVYNFTTWKYPDISDYDPKPFVDSDCYILTHTHEDHFHVPSLHLLDRSKPFYIPKFDEVSSPRKFLIRNTLKKMNFKNIIELEAWECFNFNDIFKITRIPSAKQRAHDWENSSYLVEEISSGKTILNMNDNVSDPCLLSEIKEYSKQITCLLVQAGGVTMYPGLFKMKKSEMKKEAKKRTTNFTDQKNQILALNPENVVPFAADFCWLDEDMFHVNFTNRSDPILFNKMLKEIDYKGQLVNLTPSKSWVVSTKYTFNDYNWTNREVELRTMQKKYKSKLDSIKKYITDSSTLNLIERTKERLEIQRNKINPDIIDFKCCILIHIEEKNANDSFYIKYEFGNGKMNSSITKEVPINSDILLHVDSKTWAAVLEGRLMQGILQWSGLHEHLTPHRHDIAKAWYWLEYYSDLNNKNPQAHIDNSLVENYYSSIIDPYRGVF